MNGVVRSMVLVVAPVWGEALSVLYERVSTGQWTPYRAVH